MFFILNPLVYNSLDSCAPWTLLTLSRSASTVSRPEPCIPVNSCKHLQPLLNVTISMLTSVLRGVKIMHIFSQSSDWFAAMPEWPTPCSVVFQAKLACSDLPPGQPAPLALPFACCYFQPCLDEQRVNQWRTQEWMMSGFVLLFLPEICCPALVAGREGGLGWVVSHCPLPAFFLSQELHVPCQLQAMAKALAPSL